MYFLQSYSDNFNENLGAVSDEKRKTTDQPNSRLLLAVKNRQSAECSIHVLLNHVLNQSTLEPLH